MDAKRAGGRNRTVTEVSEMERCADRAVVCPASEWVYDLQSDTV